MHATAIYKLHLSRMRALHSSSTTTKKPGPGRRHIGCTACEQQNMAWSQQMHRVSGRANGQVGVLPMQRQKQQQQQQRHLCTGRVAPRPFCAHRCSMRTHAASTTSTPLVLASPPNPLLVGVVEALFKLPPVFDAATKKARAMIIQRSEAIGLDWAGTMAALKQQDWDARMQEVTDPDVGEYPSYYTQPFHAYKQGNLCWDAALEFTLSSASVHAPVMDPDNKVMDPEGDAQLRSSYGRALLQLLGQLPGAPDASDVTAVLDVGCATGLSSLALRQLFPGAHVTGVDLSPHMVAVGRYFQQQREAESGSAEPLTLLHRKAEDSRLPGGSFDVVSMCLVAHELPQHATRAILAEAHRLLRPGGVMAIMEMNPASPAFQRVFSNAFAYTAFKSTEPWLMEYVTLDLAAALTGAGFEAPLQAENSPRHRTVVALKPRA